jgi:hypothetical protein
LANIGLGHGAVDGGGGYTYFALTLGHEFSAVTGITYNLVIGLAMSARASWKVRQLR